MCFAQGQIIMEKVPEKISEGELIEVKIQIVDTNVASFTLQIYFNTQLLEYIQGPENSNYSDNRILYTWVEEKAQAKSHVILDSFLFKGVQEGNSSIVVTGEFYNAKGEQISIENGSLEVLIGNPVQLPEKQENLVENDTNVMEDDTNLKILRLNQEGISPEFDKQIKEYYFVTDKPITSLEVTAIPENPDAKVRITGNDSLKIGSNTITIQVESKDRTKTEEYKIYVTKTTDASLANANLETLAIRQGTIVPEFDNNHTHYKTEIANETEVIDLLAIPQDINAEVQIVGNTTMQEGNNKIEIIVMARDGITKKKYEIIVHRRSIQEEQQKVEEQKMQTERLSAIIEEKEQEKKKEQNQEQPLLVPEQNQNDVIVISIVIAVAIVIGVGIYLLQKRTNK